LSANVENNIPLVVLIDADNASPKIIEGLLAEVAKLGSASVKRIYGDWTTPNLGQWKGTLLEHSIQPVQQFRYTSGKNATDSAMIINAMDLLYTGPFLGFCIVSSDSDFTRLASRIKESGKRVYGFGEQKTPRSFVAACDRFIYTEVFSASAGAATDIKQKTSRELRTDTQLVNLFRSAIEAASDENGWAHLAGVGSNIIKQATDFDPRNYGYQKLSELAGAIGLFEIARVDQRILIKEVLSRYQG
jgi:uncharacterized LabA/DUF88 family protein